MSVADEIEKLNKLRVGGILSQEEFDQQKNSLLGLIPNKPSNNSAFPEDGSAIPLKNKWWFQVVLLLLIVPVGLCFMLFCTAYTKRGGKITRIGKGAKAFIIICWVLPWILGLLRLANRPDASSSSSTSPSVSDSQTAAAATVPPSCSDKSLNDKAIEAVNTDYDKYATPRPSDSDMQLLKSQLEANDAYAQQLKRTLVANSNGALRPENIKVCEPADTRSSDAFTVILITKGDHVGGVVTNYGIPGRAAPFGDDVGQY